MNAIEFRELRERLGLTREALARALGLSSSQLADYESGWKRGTDRPASIPPVVELAMMHLTEMRTRWRGRLGHLTPVPVRVGGRLGAVQPDVPKFAGVAANLSLFFGARAGYDDLAWTSGSLRIEGLAEAGRLRAVRVSVDPTPIAEGAPLRLKLADGLGHCEEIELSPEAPSYSISWRNKPGLQGALEDLELDIAINDNENPRP